MTDQKKADPNPAMLHFTLPDRWRSFPDLSSPGDPYDEAPPAARPDLEGVPSSQIIYCSGCGAPNDSSKQLRCFICNVWLR